MPVDNGYWEMKDGSRIKIERIVNTINLIIRTSDMPESDKEYLHEFIREIERGVINNVNR